MLKNLRIGTRLLMLIGFLSILLIGVGLVGQYGIRLTLKRLELVYEDGIVSLANLKRISELYGVNIINTFYKVRAGVIGLDEGYKIINDSLNKSKEYWKTYLQGVRQTTNERALVEKVEKSMENVNVILNKILPTIKNHQSEEIDHFLQKEMYPNIDPLIIALDELIEEEVKVASEEYLAALDTFRNVRLTNIISVIFGILLGVIFAVFIIRGITRPLALAVDAADAIAIGKTNIEIAPESKDEVGRLILSMQKIKNYT